MLSTIIVAAGSGQRMGFDKLLAKLDQHSVLWHTIQRFTQYSEVEEIILVCPLFRYHSLLAEGDLLTAIRPSIKQVEGGSERHHSVQAGLRALSPNSLFCAIHDGARPLISPSTIRDCYIAAQSSGAAALARPATETIKKQLPDETLLSSISRDHLWFMETPQIFATPLIKSAYDAVEQCNKLVTDEVSALQLIQQPTTLVNSSCFNLKITYPVDLHLAQKILKS